MGMKATIRFEIPGNFVTGYEVEKVMNDLYKRIVEDGERLGAIVFKGEQIGFFKMKVELE